MCKKILIQYWKKNLEIYELLKQFDDFITSYDRKIIAGWFDGLPCLRFAGNSLHAYYDGKYCLTFNSHKQFGSFETLDELMEAVTLEVSKL